MAFITDSSTEGPNGLASWTSPPSEGWRKLTGHRQFAPRPDSRR